MLERLNDAPERAMALLASGTVMARDVEAAVEAALGSTAETTGLAIVIAEDFDGYAAELARGLADVTATHKAIGRIAVVAGADRFEDSWINGWNAPAALIRRFAPNERAAAYGWAAGRD